MTASPPSPSHHGRAFSLVEVTLALGIVSFALLSIVGLTVVGMNRGSDAKKLQEAASIANRILQMRRSAPTAATAGTLFDPNTFPLPPLTNSLSKTCYLTSSGTLTNSATSADTAYGLDIDLTVPVASLRPIVTSKVSLKVFWPPVAANPQSYQLVTEILAP